jgi:hypothetical protein
VKACNGRQQQEHDNTSRAQLMNFVSQLPERPAVLHAPKTCTTTRMAIAAALLKKTTVEISKQQQQQQKSVTQQTMHRKKEKKEVMTLSYAQAYSPLSRTRSQC